MGERNNWPRSVCERWRALGQTTCCRQSISIDSRTLASSRWNHRVCDIAYSNRLHSRKQDTQCSAVPSQLSSAGSTEVRLGARADGVEPTYYYDQFLTRLKVNAIEVPEYSIRRVSVLQPENVRVSKSLSFPASISSSEKIEITGETPRDMRELFPSDPRKDTRCDEAVPSPDSGLAQLRNSLIMVATKSASLRRLDSAPFVRMATTRPQRFPAMADLFSDCHILQLCFPVER